MYLDLHLHTTASDGQYTPTEVVRMAHDLGLELMAITDHDTVDGIAEARDAAAEVGIRFIPGIEIATEDGQEIHMLGYNIDENNPLLQAKCEEFCGDREGRAERICAYLTSIGIPVAMEEIREIAGEGVIGRPHFAQYLQEHGFVKTRQQAFDKYLNSREFKKATDRVKPTPEEAIELIHEAGGEAFLAHPMFLKMGWREQEDYIAKLQAAGLDGMECYYSQHYSKQVAEYLRIAHNLGLKVSAGSDYHGELVKPNVKMGMRIEPGTNVHTFTNRL